LIGCRLGQRIGERGVVVDDENEFHSLIYTHTAGNSEPVVGEPAIAKQQAIERVVHHGVLARTEARSSNPPEGTG